MGTGKHREGDLDTPPHPTACLGPVSWLSCSPFSKNAGDSVTAPAPVGGGISPRSVSPGGEGGLARLVLLVPVPHSSLFPFLFLECLTLAAAAGRQPRHLTSGAASPAPSRTPTLRPRVCSPPMPPPRPVSQPSLKPRARRELGAEGGAGLPHFPQLRAISGNSGHPFGEQVLPSVLVGSGCPGQVSWPAGESGLAPSCLGTQGRLPARHPRLAGGPTAPARIPGQNPEALEVRGGGCPPRPHRPTEAKTPRPALRPREPGLPAPVPSAAWRASTQGCDSVLSFSFLSARLSLLLSMAQAPPVLFWRLGHPACSPRVREWEPVGAALWAPGALRQEERVT